MVSLIATTGLRIVRAVLPFLGGVRSFRSRRIVALAHRHRRYGAGMIVLKTIFELRWQPAALRIGQVIFDPNGEYANENAQDAGER